MNLKTAYRPLKYSEVAGQTVTKKILAEEVKRGIHSASYIFAGQYGGGKTTLARIHAMAVNCENPSPNGDPCCKCKSCRSIIRGENPDIKEIAAAEDNGVSMAKKLAEDISFAPVMAKVKFYILDEAHALSAACWQVLLKVLEEAPEYCAFIMCTTEFQKVPLPVRSRSMRCDFYRIRAGDIAEQIKKVALAEQRSVTEDAAKAIAMFSEGSMRNALGLLEKALAYSENVDVSEVFASIGKADTRLYCDIIECLLRADRQGYINKLSDFAGAMPLDTFVQDMINLVMDMCLIRAGGRVDGWDSYLHIVSSVSNITSLQTLTRLASLLVSVLNRRETASSIIMAEMLMIFEELSKMQGPACDVKEEIEIKEEAAAVESTASKASKVSTNDPKPSETVKESKVSIIDSSTMSSEKEPSSSEETELHKTLKMLCEKEPLFRWLFLPVKQAQIDDNVLLVVTNPEDHYITKMLTTIVKRYHLNNIKIN